MNFNDNKYIIGFGLFVVIIIVLISKNFKSQMNIIEGLDKKNKKKVKKIDEDSIKDIRKNIKVEIKELKKNIKYEHNKKLLKQLVNKSFEEHIYSCFNKAYNANNSTGFSLIQLASITETTSILDMINKEIL